MPDFSIKGDITEFLLICILVSIILNIVLTPNSGAGEFGFLKTFMLLLGMVVFISYLLFSFLVLGESFILPWWREHQPFQLQTYL